MGAVVRRSIRRIALLLALAAVLVPVGAHAETTTSYYPAWGLGPQGGDQWNQYQRNADTGELLVLRVNPAGISGGLGCGGVGGYSNFEVAHNAEGAVNKVSISYTDALVDPYTFINIGIRQGANYLTSKVVRGPLLGDGTIDVGVPNATGAITIWFGIQVASACPNIDGGRAIFKEVRIEEG